MYKYLASIWCQNLCTHLRKLSFNFQLSKNLNNKHYKVYLLQRLNYLVLENEMNKTAFQLGCQNFCIHRPKKKHELYMVIVLMLHKSQGIYYMHPIYVIGPCVHTHYTFSHKLAGLHVSAFFRKLMTPYLFITRKICVLKHT